MQAPDRAELHAALHGLRQAAEKVKNYDAELIEQALAAIATHIPTVTAASGLRPDVDARRNRIIQECRAVEEAVSRVKQYPDLIMARAVVLDHVSALVRQVRETMQLLGAP
jgi:hypothetical protein